MSLPMDWQRESELVVPGQFETPLWAKRAREEEADATSRAAQVRQLPPVPNTGMWAVAGGFWASFLSWCSWAGDWRGATAVRRANEATETRVVEIRGVGAGGAESLKRRATDQTFRSGTSLPKGPLTRRQHRRTSTSPSSPHDFSSSTSSSGADNAQDITMGNSSSSEAKTSSPSQGPPPFITTPERVSTPTPPPPPPPPTSLDDLTRQVLEQRPSTPERGELLRKQRERQRALKRVARKTCVPVTRPLKSSTRVVGREAPRRLDLKGKGIHADYIHRQHHIEAIEKEVCISDVVTQPKSFFGGLVPPVLFHPTPFGSPLPPRPFAPCRYLSQCHLNATQSYTLAGSPNVQQQSSFDKSKSWTPEGSPNRQQLSCLVQSQSDAQQMSHGDQEVSSFNLSQSHAHQASHADQDEDDLFLSLSRSYAHQTSHKDHNASSFNRSLSHGHSASPGDEDLFLSLSKSFAQQKSYDNQNVSSFTQSHSHVQQMSHGDQNGYSLDFSRSYTPEGSPNRQQQSSFALSQSHDHRHPMSPEDEDEPSFVSMMSQSEPSFISVPPVSPEEPRRRARSVHIALNPANGLPSESVREYHTESPVTTPWKAHTNWSASQVEDSLQELGNQLSYLRLPLKPQPPPGLQETPFEFPSNIACGDTPAWSNDLRPNRHFSPLFHTPAHAPQEPVQPESAARSRASAGPASSADFHASAWLAASSALQVGRGAEASSHKDTDHDLWLDQALEDLKLEVGSPSGETNRRLQIRRSERQQAAAAEKARRIAEAAAVEAAKIRKAQEKAAAEAKKRREGARRQPRSQVVKPLSKEWQDRIDKETNVDNDHIVVTSSKGTELRGKDFARLDPGTWLNDEAVNGYIGLVVDHTNNKFKAKPENKNVKVPRVVVQLSFFYKDLVEKGPAGVARYNRRQKAMGKDLLQAELFLVPICEDSHWTLLVVSPKERTLEYFDSLRRGAVSANDSHVKNIKAFLKDQLKDSYKEDEWKLLPTRSMQQSNGCDCGVFAITNAECVAGGIDTSCFSMKDMQMQRRRIAAVLLNDGFSGELVPAEEL